MMGNDENGDDLRDPASSKRETLASLVPRVVLRGPFASKEPQPREPSSKEPASKEPASKELGPVRDLTVRAGCVVVVFDGGVEIEFHGERDLWTALLAKVHAGELFLGENALSGSSRDPRDAWHTVAAEVARRRFTQ